MSPTATALPSSARTCGSIEHVRPATVIELGMSAETTPAARVPGTPSALELVVTVVVPEEDDDDDTDVETDELEELEFETDETETLPGAPGVPWIAPVAVGDTASISCNNGELAALASGRTS